MSDAGWTDLILGLVALGLGFRLMFRGGGPQTVGVGLFLVGLAAAFGVARYASGDQPSLVVAHRGVTGMASLVGMPLVGVGYLTAAFFPERAHDVRRYAFVVLLVGAVFLLYVQQSGTVLGALGMAAVLVGAGRALRVQPLAGASGMLGALGVIVSGLVIGGPGDWGPLSRTAWFHLAFTLSCVALAGGVLTWPARPGSDRAAVDAPPAE